MRLYIITKDNNFDELDDDKTVANCQIKDGDKLYLLTYRWLHNEVDVTVLKSKTKLQGVETDETCLGIKVKVQDQTGLPANALYLTHRLDIRDCASGRFITDENKGCH